MCGTPQRSRTTRTGAPSLTTDALQTSPIGTYTIFAALGSLASQNYIFTFANGVLTVNAAPSMSLTKTASLLNYTMAGQIITYTYTIRNTGNVSLTGPFTVTDDKLGAIACGASSLVIAPGAASSCTATHAVILRSDRRLRHERATATGSGISSNEGDRVWRRLHDGCGTARPLERRL